MWALFAVPLLVTGACQLEDLLFCNFSINHCHFYDSNIRAGEHSQSFQNFINKPLRSDPNNRNCPRPSLTEPFTVSIEPCFTDFATPVDPNAQQCPDIPPEYYTNNGRVVETVVDLNTSSGTAQATVDLTLGNFISGDPIEYHIISVGRHFIFGEKPSQYSPFTGANNVTYGLSVKDFKFRTLPLTADEFHKLNPSMQSQTVPTGNQCPIEVTFADDRTNDMDLKQQMENIYVLASKYYADIGNGNLNGRGCYMCYNMNGENYTDAIKSNPDDWLRQYSKGCEIEALEYGGAYSTRTDSDYIEDKFHGKTDDGREIFKRLYDHRFKRTVLAGTYTLYPIVNSIGTTLTVEQMASLQLKYVLDPEYHITVEIVGMKKKFASKIFRNLHGRLLEKNLVEFEPFKTSLYGETLLRQEKEVEMSWVEPTENEDKPHDYYPKPNKCLISYAFHTNRMGGSDEVVVCQSDTGDITEKQHKLDPARFLAKTFPPNESAMQNPFADDYCVHKPGQIKVEFSYITFCENFPDFWHTSPFMTTDTQEFTTCEYESFREEFFVFKMKYQCSPQYESGKETIDKIYRYYGNSGNNQANDFFSLDNTQIDKLWERINSPEFISYFPQTICDFCYEPYTLNLADCSDGYNTGRLDFVGFLRQECSKFPMLCKLVFKDPFGSPPKFTPIPRISFKTDYIGTEGLCGPSCDSDYDSFTSGIWPGTTSIGKTNLGCGADGYQHWAPMGFFIPKELSSPQSCPFKPEHGQIRMVPSVDYTLFDANRTQCPPENCGRSCVSRFTDTEYFRTWISGTTRTPNTDALPEETKLPLTYLDPILTSSMIQNIIDGPYRDYCNEIEAKTQTGSINLVEQFTACGYQKDNCDYDDQNAIESLGDKCNEPSLLEKLSLGYMPGAFSQWIIESLNEFIREEQSSNGCLPGDFDILEYLPELWDCSYVFSLMKYMDNEESDLARIENNKFCGTGDAVCSVMTNNSGCSLDCAQLSLSRRITVEKMVSNLKFDVPDDTIMDPNLLNANLIHSTGNAPRQFAFYNDFEFYYTNTMDKKWRKMFNLRGLLFSHPILDLKNSNPKKGLQTWPNIDQMKQELLGGNYLWISKIDDGPYNLSTLQFSREAGQDFCGAPYGTAPPDNANTAACSYQVRAGWRSIKLFCEDRVASNVDEIAHLNCNNLMYDAFYYGTDFSLESSVVATWNNVIATKPIYTGFDGDIDTIVAESNIIGVSVAQPVFSSTSLLQFPAGLVINSTHPTIHTRIQRDLGDTGSSLESINCNVILLRTPNVRFENVEFDNAGCQEDALDIAASHSSNFLALAFKFYKGWNFAAVRLTKSLADADPTNISFVSGKFTSAVNFRRKFPGRPLFSADNAARQTEWVNIDGLYVSDANDTFDYVVDSKAGTEVNLMPLDMIMWHYKGDVSFGFFSEYWEAVSYGPSSESSTSGAFYAQAANEVVSSENCKNITPIVKKDDYIYFVRYNRFAPICCNIFGADPLPEDQYNYWDIRAPICQNSSVTISNCTSFPSDDGEFYGYNTSQEYCQEKGGSECIYVEGQCRKNAVTVRDRLQILDGNDFFDLAADRFRCFDPLTIDCTSKMIAEAVTIVTVGIILMATVHYLYKGIKAFQEEPCISILESREQVLDEADPLEYADIDD